MTFPRLLVIAEGSILGARPETAILGACQGGARWFCVRDKNAAPREFLEFTRRVARVGEKFGAKIFVNGRADLARAAHADGLHLPEREISVADARITLGFHLPIGRSVHSLESAKLAQSEGAAYLLFGPVFSTPSHPESPAQGLEALREVAASVQIPVFAVGGIAENNAAACLEAGAFGVAAISSVWNGDAVANVRALRAALGERDEPIHHAAHLFGANQK